MVNDLIGGVKNAMERGQDMNKIRQSFVNAGYKKEDVEDAINSSNSIYATANQNPIPQNQTQQTPIQPALEAPSPQQTSQQNQPQSPSFQQLPSPTPTQPKEKKSHLWIILIVASILILIGAALLGLYWDKIIELIK
jgi:hypothetical protein